jgi:hypothetical protein
MEFLTWVTFRQSIERGFGSPRGSGWAQSARTFCGDFGTPYRADFAAYQVSLLHCLRRTTDNEDLVRPCGMCTRRAGLSAHVERRLFQGRTQKPLWRTKGEDCRILLAWRGAQIGGTRRC